MSRGASPFCLICQKQITEKSVIFVTGAQAEYDVDYYGNPDTRIGFTGKRNPRGIVHRKCWESLIIEVEEEKIPKPKKITNRLKSIE